MNVTDYGQIFVPQKYGIHYCKSPQALLFNDFVRVYFSYCIPDNEKLISRVGFAEFDKEFKEVKRVSTRVMKDGGLGTFDEHGIFPFSPFRDGETIKAVTSGWSRRKSVSVETAIGLAISNDNGETFERYGIGPVLTASLNEPYLVVDGFVVKLQDGCFRMYYIYGTEWRTYDGIQQPERTYRISYADSKDLLNWKRSGQFLIPERVEQEAQALPSVVYWHKKWHMFFCYRHTCDFRSNRDKSYRIGYAWSKDLEFWTRVDGNITIPSADWNNEMQCYPNAFVMDDQLFLLYNGNRFGKNGFGLLKIEEG